MDEKKMFEHWIASNAVFSGGLEVWYIPSIDEIIIADWLTGEIEGANGIWTSAAKVIFDGGVYIGQY
jgi:hypothetical protein